jgi:hypothetical protein
MYKRFENDNVFIFSKKSCELLKSSGVKLKRNGLVVNNEKYGIMKRKLKKVITLDWSSMKALKKFKERTVILDVIDKYRANSEYIGILKEMEMDQRVLKIEPWLKSCSWKFNTIRKIRNFHIIGKLEKRSLSKQRLWTEKHVVTVPECAEFERVSSWNVDKVEKAINYLRWKNNKLKLVKNNNVSNAVIDELFGNTKIKYGIQVKLNNFLIWKYTVRWNLYAEITLLSGKATFGYLRNRTKRRRLEILFSLIPGPILKNRFEMNKLYLINRDNLKRLVQFIRRKRKRRLKEEIVSSEHENDLWKEEIGKNWKNRREKPPDKIVTMNFKIISRKEYNLLRRNMKMDKQSRRNEDYCDRKGKDLSLLNYNWKNICQNGRSYSNDVYCDAEKNWKRCNSTEVLLDRLVTVIIWLKVKLILCA